MKVLVLLVIGIWLGMVMGISFLEAPLKFRAPNITLPLGLGIGKIVFAALNKFELFFSIILAVWLLLQYQGLGLASIAIFLSLILAVILQTFWLLPILDARADSIISGQVTPPTRHHLYYIFIEVGKLLLLIAAFLKTYYYEGH